MSEKARNYFKHRYRDQYAKGNDRSSYAKKYREYYDISYRNEGRNSDENFDEGNDFEIKNRKRFCDKIFDESYTKMFMNKCLELVNESKNYLAKWCREMVKKCKKKYHKECMKVGKYYPKNQQDDGSDRNW